MLHNWHILKSTLSFFLKPILLLLTASFLIFNHPAVANEPVILAVNQDIPHDYQHFLKGRDPLTINKYSGEGARRDIIELVLLMQALHLGGFKHPIEIRVEPSYLRILRGIADGQFVSSGALMWKTDIDMLQQAYFISRPVVKQGEFIVGIYTGAKHQKALNAMEPEKLKNLNVVTNIQWRSDVQTLKDLGFKHITYSPNWVNMARMIEAGRADITLAPFQTSPGMTIAVNDVTLYPIKGVTVAISGSRHWAVSRKHPKGEAFHQALERGLEELESKGIIQQAYRECGFFHPDVAQWKLLRPEVEASLQ